MPTKIFLDAPPDFSFRHTVASHGWSNLPPFATGEDYRRLFYVFSSEFLTQPLAAEITENDKTSQIEINFTTPKINSRAAAKILRDTRHILRLDDDLSEFYQLVGREKSLGWIKKNQAGRLLRSPTVFEDLIKTVCTTNCSWSLTKIMTKNLVEKLGEKTADGKFAFPTAEKMAVMDEKFYREEIRAGYRSAYFVEMTNRIAAGEINPENWLDSDLPTAELKKQMKKIKGVGDYAAENLLKLVGRYDGGLALDSWVRAGFYRKHNGETKCPDAQIENFYDKFGAWRGLVVWCDMTEKWF